MDEKIAILTEYYESSNYGGNLQAYALTRFLNDNGYPSEQLPYIRPTHSFIDKLCEMDGIDLKIALIIKKVIQKTIKRKDFLRVKKRRALVVEFGKKHTPHHVRAYTDDELMSSCTDSVSDVARNLRRYCMYITGSDQVWRDIEKKAYFLTFVPKGKKKISYAASISKVALDSEESGFFREALKDYDGVSVREKSDVKLIENVCEKQVEWVLDPTLLLEANQWDEITSPRLHESGYVFCYFLGNEKKPRMLAREYAKRHNLDILTMPYLTSDYPYMDFWHAREKEERLFEVGVEDFLSLIKYADAVFTDSFHAVVFSGIYKRQYYVFERAISVSMSTRINSLLEIYETPERFCNTAEKENMTYLEDVKPIDYTRPLENLEGMKAKSKEWLKNNIVAFKA